MVPWIQVYSNLLTHPKTTALADQLDLRSSDVNPNVVAAGMLISLWTWAIQNAYDGDLALCTPRAIAEACTYKKKPQKLLEALVNSGWIDADEDSLKLHDWEEYAVLLIEAENNKRVKTKERVQKYRAKKREVSPLKV